MLVLQQPLSSLDPHADTFYIHDLAVADAYRKTGLGRRLAAALIDVGRQRGFRRFELVSVQGSAPFWATFGFQAVRAFEYAPGAPAVKMAMTSSA